MRSEKLLRAIVKEVVIPFVDLLAAKINIEDEKKVHMILEFESMEKGGEWLTRPDILEKRVEAGAVIESTVIIPLKD